MTTTKKQILNRQPDKFGVGRILGHLRNRDRAQHLRDAFIHSPQRLTHRAGGTLIAVPMIRYARGDHDRPIHGVDYIERRNFLRMPGQLIAATRTVTRRQEPVLRQPLQHLGQKRRGNPVRIGDIGCALRGFPTMRRQVPDGDQGVIRFLGEL